MFPIYSERQTSRSRPESEHEYFMRAARNLRDQRRREKSASRGLAPGSAGGETLTSARSCGTAPSR
jgi:hypothetical protein